tara:strand:+ start:1021 stop:1605 length:585 start_codon:yes stop_codon:yes gene_type:complete
MSEAIDLKELPHQFLLKKYAINKNALSKDTKQLIADLEKTIRLVAINSKKKGNINLTPATQQKISTYDRYICEGIYDYIEDEEKEDNIIELEDDMQDKREVVEDKMEDAHNEAVDQSDLSENAQEEATKENKTEEKNFKDVIIEDKDNKFQGGNLEGVSKDNIKDNSVEVKKETILEPEPKKDDDTFLGFWDFK